MSCGVKTFFTIIRFTVHHDLNFLTPDWIGRDVFSYDNLKVLALNSHRFIIIIKDSPLMLSQDIQRATK